MKQGSVDHIEFYPGYYGTEELWTGWSNPRECAPVDLAACISNTKAMRDAALTILNGGAAPPSWTQLAPAGGPPEARYGHSAAMDSASHRMIVFGGNSWTSALNDTWILTNADGQHGQPAWIPVVTATAPPAAAYSTGMYDPNSNRMSSTAAPPGPMWGF
jgi:Kelch motif